MESKATGEREISWDGRNLAGRQATSGVYFARLVADGKTVATRRIALLK
jgi:hypothetical protein